jgi:hypothetical protein
MLILAVVILVSSDDEEPHYAIVGTLIVFMIAGVSYAYCTAGSHRDALMLNKQRQTENPGYGWEKKHRSIYPASKSRF